MKSGKARAMKLERLPNSKPVIKMEVAVLHHLSGQDHVPQFYGCGRTPQFNFVVMSLVGPNLSELRKQQPLQRFSFSVAALIGLQLLAAIEVVHEHGVLHRDIKPSNFAIGLEPLHSRLFILDFGLARIYRTTLGDVRPARSTAGFRGTARYASLGTHRGSDMGRVDDMWSFFYMMVELVTGALPWRRIKDRHEVCAAKEACDHRELVRALPPVFAMMLSAISALGYADRPDYAAIARELQTLRDARAAHYGPVRFPWEQGATPSGPGTPVADRTLVPASPLKLLTLRPTTESLPDAPRPPSIAAENRTRSDRLDSPQPGEPSVRGDVAVMATASEAQGDSSSSGSPSPQARDVPSASHAPSSVTPNTLRVGSSVVPQFATVPEIAPHPPAAPLPSQDSALRIRKLRRQFLVQSDS